MRAINTPPHWLTKFTRSAAGLPARSVINLLLQSYKWISLHNATSGGWKTARQSAACIISLW
jgi:hypothetical protein